MDEAPSFGPGDLFSPVECLVNVSDELDDATEVLAQLDPERVRPLWHHYLGGRSQDTSRVCERYGVVAGRYARDSVTEGGGVQIEHHRQRPAGLEAPGPLKELLFQPDACRFADGTGEGVVGHKSDWCRDHEITQPLSVGPNVIDSRDRKWEVLHHRQVLC